MKNKSINRSRGRWVLVALFAMMLSMALALWSCTQARDDALLSTGFQPPVMAAAQYAKGPVRGDLGGVLVEIPSHMAEYVEYDGDAGWKGNEKDAKSIRAYDSKIKSFGFNVRYPEMTGKYSFDERKDYFSRNYGTTNWFYVVLISGEAYSGVESIDNLARTSLERKLNPEGEFLWDRYEKLSSNDYGLEMYALKEIDSKTGKSYRESADASDIFVSRNSNGKALSYISCSNWYSESALCSHYFNLAPTMKVEVAIHYRRGFLSQWNEIQDKVSDLIIGFATKS